MRRIGAVACLLAFACGGSSHTADPDGGTARDGGAGHDGGARRDGGGPVFEDAGDAGSTPDRCPELLSTYPSVGLPELPGLERAMGTVVGVDPSGADLDIGGRAARWAWPADWAGSGIDRLAPGMEVELWQSPGQSRLVAPGVTLHAFVGYGNYPMAPFAAPILVDGVPPLRVPAVSDGR